jgi:hypothetical protein
MQREVWAGVNSFVMLRIKTLSSRRESSRYIQGKNSLCEALHRTNKILINLTLSYILEIIFLAENMTVF